MKGTFTSQEQQQLNSTDMCDDSVVVRNTRYNIGMAEQFNPLVEPLPGWYRFYRRIRLVPWWLRHNIWMVEQADLMDKLIKLSTNMGLNDKIVKKIIRHAVSEFSKHGLGVDYYGYHNIDHEGSGEEGEDRIHFIRKPVEIKEFIQIVTKELQRGILGIEKTRCYKRIEFKQTRQQQY